MLTILYIVMISILLIFLVFGFLIWRKFNPIIRKMMENLEKMGKTTPKTTIYNNNFKMRQQIKEIQETLQTKKP